jgi:hypothetical protein
MNHIQIFFILITCFAQSVFSQNAAQSHTDYTTTIFDMKFGYERVITINLDNDEVFQDFTHIYYGSNEPHLITKLSKIIFYSSIGIVALFTLITVKIYRKKNRTNESKEDLR